MPAVDTTDYLLLKRLEMKMLPLTVHPQQKIKDSVEQHLVVIHLLAAYMASRLMNFASVFAVLAM